MSEILISLVVPTRGGVDRMTSFLKSLHDNAASADTLEVVMVVDEDDLESQAISFDGLRLIKVVIPPGLTMGAMNMAGYRASCGAYIMLTNDDVIVRTPGWDQKCLDVFRSFPDDIVLAHVNDAMFKETLCIFPFVSRKFCELAGGICREEYKRYRIDDDIYSIFSLLAVVGYKRIIYLPDVVFEHQNFEVDAGGTARYIPNLDIHAEDTQTFQRLFPQRKQLAVRLSQSIDSGRRRGSASQRQDLLAPVDDYESLQSPELMEVRSNGRPKADSRITIGIVSNNQGRPRNDGLKSIVAYTRNYDLIRSYGGDVRCGAVPHQINQILDACRSNFLVIVRDDVRVDDGWIAALLDSMEPHVAIVTPLLFDRHEKVTTAGITLCPDESGLHGPTYDIPSSLSPIQIMNSAVFLIDMNKIGHLRFNEAHRTRFFDVDFSLQVWEEGFQVVVAPRTRCFGGGLRWDGNLQEARDAFSYDQKVWNQKWIGSGRLRQLVDTAWRKIPAFLPVLDLPETIDALIADDRPQDDGSWNESLRSCAKVLSSAPILGVYGRQQIQRAIARTTEHDRLEYCRGLIRRLGLDDLKPQTLVGADVLWFLPWWAEREVGKFLCSVGAIGRGQTYWNNSILREKIGAGELALLGETTDKR